MSISDLSSDVCSSDLIGSVARLRLARLAAARTGRDDEGGGQGEGGKSLHGEVRLAGKEGRIFCRGCGAKSRGDRNSATTPTESEKGPFPVSSPRITSGVTKKARSRACFGTGPPFVLTPRPPPRRDFVDAIHDRVHRLASRRCLGALLRELAVGHDLVQRSAGARNAALHPAKRPVAELRRPLIRHASRPHGAPRLAAVRSEERSGGDKGGLKS